MVSSRGPYTEYEYLSQQSNTLVQRKCEHNIGEQKRSTAHRSGESSCLICDASCQILQAIFQDLLNASNKKWCLIMGWLAQTALASQWLSHGCHWWDVVEGSKHPWWACSTVSHLEMFTKKKKKKKCSLGGNRDSLASLESTSFLINYKINLAYSSSIKIL